MILYQVTKRAPRDWQVAAFADRPGWFGPPLMVTRDIRGRKAAEKLARELAGEAGRVTVVEAARR